MLQRDVITFKTRKTTRRLTPERLPTNMAMAVAAHFMLAGQRVMGMAALVVLGAGMVMAALRAKLEAILAVP
tara:strand:+ start:97 stop:312 length:216 start_codon:yes stop_codon:yes gene_type:complete